MVKMLEPQETRTEPADAAASGHHDPRPASEVQHTNQDVPSPENKGLQAPASGYLVLDLPPAPSKEPKVDQPVAHAPGQLWQQSDLANHKKYIHKLELSLEKTHAHTQANLEASSGELQKDASVEVFWSKRGFWSYYEPTGTDKALHAAAQQAGVLGQDDAHESYQSDNLGGRKVYVDELGIHHYYHRQVDTAYMPTLPGPHTSAESDPSCGAIQDEDALSAATPKDSTPASGVPMPGCDADVAEATAKEGAERPEPKLEETQSADPQDVTPITDTEDDAARALRQPHESDLGLPQDPSLKSSSAGVEKELEENKTHVENGVHVKNEAHIENKADDEKEGEGEAEHKEEHKVHVESETHIEKRAEVEKEPEGAAEHKVENKAHVKNEAHIENEAKGEAAHKVEYKAHVDKNLEEKELKDESDTRIEHEAHIEHEASPHGAEDTPRDTTGSSDQDALDRNNMMSVHHTTLPASDASSAAGPEPTTQATTLPETTAEPSFYTLPGSIDTAPLFGASLDYCVVVGQVDLGPQMSTFMPMPMPEVHSMGPAAANPVSEVYSMDSATANPFLPRATNTSVRDAGDACIPGVGNATFRTFLDEAPSQRQQERAPPLTHPSAPEEVVAHAPTGLVASTRPRDSHGTDVVGFLNQADQQANLLPAVDGIPRSTPLKPEAEQRLKRNADVMEQGAGPPSTQGAPTQPAEPDSVDAARPRKKARSESPEDFIEISQELWRTSSSKRAADTQLQTPSPPKKARTEAAANHATPPLSSPIVSAVSCDDPEEGVRSTKHTLKSVDPPAGLSQHEIDLQNKHSRPHHASQQPSSGTGAPPSQVLTGKKPQADPRRMERVHARRAFEADLEAIKLDAPLYDGPVVQVRGILADPPKAGEGRQGHQPSAAGRPTRPSTGGSAENPISLERSPSPPPQPKTSVTIDLSSPPATKLTHQLPDTPASSAPAASSEHPSTAPAQNEPAAAPEDVETRRTTRAQDRASKRAPRPPPLDGPAFYGLQDNDYARRLMRYQDVATHAGCIPGTVIRSPLGQIQPDRLLMERFRADAGFLAAENDAVSNAGDVGGRGLKRKLTVKQQHNMVCPKHGNLHRGYGQEDEEEVGRSGVDGETPAAAVARKHRQRWVEDRPPQAAVVKGFPLVEPVEFLRSQNRDDEGNCYWNAVAMHVYGRRELGPRVKLEHLHFVEAVLINELHPRHDDYVRVNSRFVITSAEGIAEPFVANMWQLLHMPGSWTPSWMTQITADLYGLFVVLYTLDESAAQRLPSGNGTPADAAPVVTETTTRGAYNSRHIFLLFVDGNHYQPMVPNRHDGAEFRCPRPSRALTQRYKFGDSARWGDGTDHAWRRDASFGKRVPMPLPIDHNMGCTKQEISRLFDAVAKGGTGSWTVSYKR